MKRLICLLIVVFLSFCLFGCDNKENSKVESKPTNVEQEIAEPEPNTSEMVDNIISKAREDAKTASDEQKQEALDFIVDNVNKYFTGGNEMIEKVIYYGALLNYCYDDDSEISKIGNDAVQSVKYVYRGAETIEDKATLENMKQLREEIDKLT